VKRKNTETGKGSLRLSERERKRKGRSVIKICFGSDW